MNLEQGKQYFLKHTSNFCHSKGHYDEVIEDEPYTFVGTIKINLTFTTVEAYRNIFYHSNEHGKATYVMFDTREVDYAETCEAAKERIQHIIDEYQAKIDKLKEKL